MSETPPSLTKTRRAELDAMFQIGAGVDRLKGSPRGKDFERVYALGQYGMLEVNKLLASYMERYHQALKRRDTGLVLAAAYGLYTDMHGPLRVADYSFLNDFLNQAMFQLSDEKISDWLDGDGVSYVASRNRKRALVEYLTEKLEDLDFIVEDAKNAREAADTEAIQPAAVAIEAHESFSEMTPETFASIWDKFTDKEKVRLNQLMDAHEASLADAPKP